MSPSPSVTSPFVSTAARICPSSWHRNSSKRRPPSLGGTAYPCVSSNRCAAPWRVRPIRYPWKSALDHHEPEAHRPCHGVRAARGTELGDDRGHVELGRVRGNVEAAG